MDLIDLVNSAIIFLPQTTLLSWLTFLLRSQLSLSKSCFLLFFLSSDDGICFTTASTPFWNSDHVVVSVCSDFPWNPLWYAVFYRIAYRIASNKHLTSNKRHPLISASHLGIQIEISTSPLISATPLNVALIRIVTIYY